MSRVVQGVVSAIRPFEVEHFRTVGIAVDAALGVVFALGFSDVVAVVADFGIARCDMGWERDVGVVIKVIGFYIVKDEVA